MKLILWLLVAALSLTSFSPTLFAQTKKRAAKRERFEQQGLKPGAGFRVENDGEKKDPGLGALERNADGHHDGEFYLPGVSRAGAGPNAAYLVGRDGKSWSSKVGFDPEKMRAAIVKLLPPDATDSGGKK